jgi:hypothetical protein
MRLPHVLPIKKITGSGTSIYFFSIPKPEAVRRLLRHLTASNINNKIPIKI